MEWSLLTRLLIIALFNVMLIVPVVVILRRTGKSGWWCLMMYLPFVNIIALWLFAYGRWPALDRS
ncbi:MAG: hypothetical protein ACHQF3_14170 [Alphaproteobacteria bacterium]